VRHRESSSELRDGRFAPPVADGYGEPNGDPDEGLMLDLGFDCLTG
jgi:hypothetical protein